MNRHRINRQFIHNKLPLLIFIIALALFLLSMAGNNSESDTSRVAKTAKTRIEDRLSILDTYIEKALGPETDKDLCLDDLPECMHELEKSGSWINRAFLKGQPDYAYGIYRDYVLLGMITIQEVQHRQMSLEYRNRFQIVSEMIRDAFLRAVDYEKAIGYESQVQLRAEQYDGI